MTSQILILRRAAQVFETYSGSQKSVSETSACLAEQSDWRYGPLGVVHHQTRVWVGPMRQITSVALAAEL